MINQTNLYLFEISQWIEFILYCINLIIKFQYFGMIHFEIDRFSAATVHIVVGCVQLYLGIGIFSFCCGSDDNCSFNFHPTCSSWLDWPGSSLFSKLSKIGFMFFIQSFIITSILLSCNCNLSFSSDCSFVGFIMNVDARFRMYDNVLISNRKSVRSICTICSSLKYRNTFSIHSQCHLFIGNVFVCKAKHSDFSLTFPIHHHRRLCQLYGLTKTCFYERNWWLLWIHHRLADLWFWYHRPP